MLVGFHGTIKAVCKRQSGYYGIVRAGRTLQSGKRNWPTML